LHGWGGGQALDLGTRFLKFLLQRDGIRRTLNAGLDLLQKPVPDSLNLRAWRRLLRIR